ncbi:hypothetical protein NPIL_158651 [Nephila pilipes]|uniref:Uncharacterized protein n=1 Tax=Nephila pilipes TaxID=299642 RepID=A0A8X6PI22_NEPPI|nr:hypothetical protein NPIL_158651 [Nephila pilipes]
MCARCRCGDLYVIMDENTMKGALKQEVDLKEIMMRIIAIFNFCMSIVFAVIFLRVDTNMLTPVQRILATSYACAIYALCNYNLYYLLTMD